MPGSSWLKLYFFSDCSALKEWLYCSAPTMPALDQNVNVTCGICGILVTNKNLSRHKSRCSGGTLLCTQCPNFSTKSQNDLNYHTAKKHSAPKFEFIFKCKLFYQEFPRFYALRQHKNTQLGIQIGSRIRDVDVEQIVGDVEDQRFREELRSCQHFLVDSELERARHKVFNYALKFLNEIVVNEKRSFFQQFKMCSKSASGFWFLFEKHRRWRIPKNSRTRKQYLAGSIQTCVHPFRLGQVERLSNKTDVIESCSREKMNTKWRFYHLTNSTVFAVLLKDVPMGCSNAVLPEHLLRNRTINCLTYEENTHTPYNGNLCLLRALALHLHGTQ